MENTTSLDLIVGLIAFVILISALVMLFQGIASFPKQK